MNKLFSVSQMKTFIAFVEKVREVEKGLCHPVSFYRDGVVETQYTVWFQGEGPYLITPCGGIDLGEEYEYRYKKTTVPSEIRDVLESFPESRWGYVLQHWEEYVYF